MVKTWKANLELSKNVPSKNHKNIFLSRYNQFYGILRRIDATKIMYFRYSKDKNFKECKDIFINLEFLSDERQAAARQGDRPAVSPSKPSVFIVPAGMPRFP
jgi:hypothetical protein